MGGKERNGREQRRMNYSHVPSIRPSTEGKFILHICSSIPLRMCAFVCSRVKKRQFENKKFGIRAYTIFQISNLFPYFLGIRSKSSSISFQTESLNKRSKSLKIWLTCSEYICHSMIIWFRNSEERRNAAIFRFKLEILQGNGYVEYFRGTEIFGGRGFRMLWPNKPLFSKPKKGHGIRQYLCCNSDGGIFAWQKK